MLSWFQALMPKEERFFDLFGQHAHTLVGGAEALNQLLQRGGDRVPECCKRIMEHEEQADEITRQTLLAVRRSFITPFDRSDIKELTTSLDDAIDQMQKTAKAITLFELREFDPDMRAIGALIVDTAKITVEAVELLRDMRRNATQLNLLTEKITHLEGQSDQLYDQGMHALFHGRGKSDPMAYIVGSEVFDHLEKVMDRFEDVANRISGVVIENL
jgi:predicted phosphate transport protein (TIGR00153 family)